MTHQLWDELLPCWAFVFIVVNLLLIIRITAPRTRNSTRRFYLGRQNSAGEEGKEKELRRCSGFASFPVCPVFYWWSLRALVFLGVCGEAGAGKRKGGFVCAMHI